MLAPPAALLGRASSLPCLPSSVLCGSRFVPILTRLLTGRVSSQQIWRYYWDTIEYCVPADEVIGALRDAGFDRVERETQLGIFTEYRAEKPRE